MLVSETTLLQLAALKYNIRTLILAARLCGAPALAAARATFLDRWASHSAVRAIHTAVAWQWLQHLAT